MTDRLSKLLPRPCAAIILTVSLTTGLPCMAVTPYTTISDSNGPITNIYLGNELGMQVRHTGDTADEVYPPATIPGDFGTFALINDTLYSIDIRNHGGSAASNIGAYTTFTPVSQTGVTGSGTLSTPYTVITTVNAGLTGITLQQTVTYVAGNEYFTTSTVLRNNGPTAQTVLLYRAMDCYLGNSDVGYGYVTGSMVACTKNPNNNPPGRIEGIFSLTPGGHYIETNYGTVWSVIGSHKPFMDTYLPTSNIDNGAGFSWSVTVPANGSVTVSDKVLFSPLITTNSNICPP